jgi:phage regulator Rha-like protein
MDNSIQTLDAVETAPQTLTANGEGRIDSRLLALHLGNAHQNLYELLRDHRDDFEELGLIRFQTGLITGRGRAEKYALLNEDQCYLLLTYTRNSARVRPLKLQLVKAFKEVRLVASQRAQEYLPTYHQLHNVIDELAAKSCNKKFVHMNVNKLVNKAAGVQAGQRAVVSLPKQSLITVAQSVAACAMQGAGDHHVGYELAKQALTKFAAITQPKLLQ